MVNVSIKVPEEIRKLMREVDVNWSEFLRGVIEDKIRVEMAKNALRKLDKIRGGAMRVPTEEVVRWIREERERSLG